MPARNDDDFILEDLDDLDEDLDRLVLGGPRPKAPAPAAAAPTPTTPTKPTPSKPPTPAPAAAPAPPPRPAYQPAPLQGTNSEKADILEDEILRSLAEMGRLIPGGAERLKELRRRRPQFWAADPATVASQIIEAIVDPDSPFREPSSGPLTPTDIAALFLGRVKIGRAGDFLAAAAECAGPNPGKTAERVAARLLDGSFDRFLKVGAPMPPGGDAILEALHLFRAELRPGLDLEQVAREWADIGNHGREAAVLSVAKRLGLPHHAASITKDGQPVRIGPRDPRVDRSPTPAPRDSIREDYRI